MSLYLATSKDDVIAVAQLIEGLPEHRKPTFAAILIAKRLVIPKNLSMRFIYWWAKRKGIVFHTFQHMFRVKPEAADVVLMNAASWCAYGKDAWSQHSAGGWSQEELDTVVAALGLTTGARPHG